MTTLSVGLDTALSGAHVLDFYALQIELPSYTLRLVDGSGFVTFDGDTYVGEDAIYGTIGSIEPISDGSENTSPRLNIVLLPPTNVAAADLASPAAQGSAVSVWYGAINPATGLVIDTPHLEFIGTLDVATLRVGKGRSLELEVASIWDALFPRDDGARLNAAFHQSVWPGELGFEFVTDVQRQLPWGADAPRPVVIRDVANTAAPQGYGGGSFDF